jgi:hypothetical protein
MKNIFFSIALICFAISPLFSQKKWNFIPKLGITQPFHVFEKRQAYPEAILFLDGPYNYDFSQKGILLGCGFERKIGNMSAIKLETNLLFKENVWLFPFDSTGTYYDYSRAFTLQIPLLYSFQPTKMIQMEAGAAFTQVIYNAPYTFAQSFAVNQGAKDNIINRSNFALSAGMTYRLGRFDLAFRWTRDLLVFARNNDTVASITDEYRQDMQFTLGYRIFR